MEVFKCLLAIAERLEAEMDAEQEAKKACCETTKACLEKMEAYLEATEACLGKVKAEIDADRKEMKACRKEEGACLKKREAGLWEVPNDKAVVEAIGTLEDRYGTGI
jgi:uncharacterized protein YicC (UPF0701 family)